jgi:hypothetical protein
VIARFAPRGVWVLSSNGAVLPNKVGRKLFGVHFKGLVALQVSLEEFRCVLWAVWLPPFSLILF